MCIQTIRWVYMITTYTGLCISYVIMITLSQYCSGASWYRHKKEAKVTIYQLLANTTYRLAKLFSMTILGSLGYATGKFLKSKPSEIVFGKFLTGNQRVLVRLTLELIPDFFSYSSE